MTLRHDLRFGARLAGRRRAFTAVTIAILALGIGANTAVFSVVKAVLLETLPFDRAEDIVYLRESTAEIPTMWVAWRNYLDWRQRNRVFQSMAANRVRQTLMGGGEGRPEWIWIAQASAEMFNLLGTPAALGRTFTAAEDRPGGPRVAVLAHATWQQRFGGRADVIGATLELDSEPYEIVGVMPPWFGYPPMRQVRLWTALGPWTRAWDRRRETHPGLTVIARLAPGVRFATARDDMRRIAGELAREYPDTNAAVGIYIRPLGEQTVRHLRPALRVLAGAVGLVLALTCVSVANLLLAHGTARRHEMAVRRSVGASPARLVGQLLTESVLLAFGGAFAALGVAHAGLSGLLALVDLEAMPVVGEIEIDGRVLAFNLVIAVATGLVCGLVPALAATRGGALAATAHGTRLRAGRGRARRALVVVEIGLALAVTLTAVLVLRSFVGLARADTGLEPRGVLTFSCVLPAASYPDTARKHVLMDELLARVRQLPGILSAATTHPILTGGTVAFSVDDRPPAADENLAAATLRVSPDYFAAMGIDLPRGRPFTERDREDARRVVIVDERLARALWPDGDALGRRLRLAGDPPAAPGREVVGVARHVKSRGPQREARRALYLPARQADDPYGYVVVRTSADPWELRRAIDRELAALDPDLVMGDVQTLERRVAAELDSERLSAAFFGVFAALALVLACAGIYGVMAESASERRAEIGLRLALGARPPDIRRQVAGEALRLASAGVVLGLVLSLAAAPLAAAQLHGLGPYDTATWLVLPIVLLLVAIVAGALPAWRASRIEPMTVLRNE